MVQAEKWKRHQDTVYWIDIQLAQQKGFKFYQTRSNAIILYDTLPAYCIPKVIMIESGEIKTKRFLRHLDLLQCFPFKDNWMKELDSEVAGGNEDSQQIQPRSKIQLSSTERPEKNEQTPGFYTKEIEKRCPVWLRKHKLENGETRKELCASVC